jgi:hypothetical protein
LPVGGYELISPERAQSILAQLPALNTFLRPVFEQDIFFDYSDRIREMGFGRTAALTFCPLEGSLHSGRMLRALKHKVLSLGVEILGGTEVHELESEAGMVEIRCRTAAGRRLNFRASVVGVCTDGLTRRLIPELDVHPARGQVLVARILNAPVPVGTFHAEEGYFYFRNLENNEILVGGGRHLAKDEEFTDSLAISQRIQQSLEDFLKERVLPPGTHFEILQRWSGTMAFARQEAVGTKTPVVGPVPGLPGIHTATRTSGMGVALGMVLGEELCESMLK